MALRPLGGNSKKPVRVVETWHVLAYDLSTKIPLKDGEPKNVYLQKLCVYAIRLEVACQAFFTLDRYCKMHYYTHMNKLNNAQIQEVCQRYLAGEPTTSLAKHFDVSATAINGLLTRRGIIMRTIAVSRRQFQCDHTFFSLIDTEVKAYWLGFFAADGYVGTRNALAVSVATEDNEHLIRFTEALQSTHPIKMYTYPKVSFAKLFIRSEGLATGLAQYGIVGNKTFTLRWPDLPAELLRHFLRGYTDGDGGFYTGKTTYPYKNVIFSVTSNEHFLEGMQQFLMTSLGLPKTKHTQRHKDSPIFTLRYTGRNQVEHIVIWLYEGATVYLPRKYIKIMDYLQVTSPI